MPIWGYIGLGALAAGLLGGWTVRDWKADSDDKAAVEALIKAKDEAHAALDKQAAGFEQWRAAQEPAKLETRNTIREIYRDAPPVSAECATPPAVVSVLEAARQRANAASAGQSGAALPGPATAP
jgi:hypothetical protein